MPTGYTAGILDGEIKTFPQFAKNCMRIDDLKKKAGIPIKDITLKGGAKQWYL